MKFSDVFKCKVPVWVNWLAMDAYGNWFIFERKPTPTSQYQWWAHESRGDVISSENLWNPEADNWKESLLDLRQYER